MGKMDFQKYLFKNGDVGCHKFSSTKIFFFAGDLFIDAKPQHLFSTLCLNIFVWFTLVVYFTYTTHTVNKLSEICMYVCFSIVTCKEDL